MRITRLLIRDFRRLHEVDVLPAGGINLLVGPNGAGKTSVLEAVHLMAYGRSFRGRVRDGLIRSGAPAVEVFVEWEQGDRTRRAGLRHGGDRWEGRLDGAPVAQLGDLCAALAVVSFEPGSHALVAGGGEPRRRFLDWGLFHVEHEFLPAWRRYARALRQRNALLKAQRGDAELDGWEQEMATAGETMTRLRADYVDTLQASLAEVVPGIAPALGAASVEFLPGWKRAELSLRDALLLARDRDRLSGHTTVGPHRADWRVAVAAAPQGEALSRGQAKLVALACLLAQAQDLARQHGHWPVVVLDDLASELDAGHRERVLTMLGSTGAQVFVTGTDLQPLASVLDAGATVFHVEHGVVRTAGPASAAMGRPVDPPEML
ncbi:DNA replication/repair protein RecF [Luteimonas yindakuii]|uniref:DNA replication and repair protein RecF n=1 Tax=Luteimonas yindakuii TaxID=2565782 RepID=A0A4Z1R872_9GAMM|nr:DNA replication/repair protein RecF [Luteimonas yindakuii]TKS55176.1 DNA replication/repair protein RecF [Luteimonas yindakuii]